jgi:exodeoxyribonuclease III
VSAFKIASWNVNSVRLRQPQILDFLEAAKPDVLCLQEIKCQNGEFPEKGFTEAGYAHQMVRGQKGMHGVAIIARHPISALPDPDFCMHSHARMAFAKIEGINICNVYIPAGGDEPDPVANPKFAHKLDFLERMQKFFKARSKKSPKDKLVLTGDLNIAPLEADVWSHKQLLKVVSHTPIEVEALKALQMAGNFADPARLLIPEPEPVFTWWSYRSKDWTKNNRGRRLDHIWVSPALKAAALHHGTAGYETHTACRSWERPSDHIPITQMFEL